MTQRAYYNSDELTMRTQVLHCSPVEDGKFRVVLAETLFHPQGGGQLSDKGSIAGVNVDRVIQEGDQLIHVTDQEVELGEALIEVSLDTRSLHARLHSAGHIIAGVGEQLGWYASKGHHWPGECRVVFERRLKPQPLTAEMLEQAVNQLISDNVPRHLEDQAGVRSVCFGDLPMHSCGGTHVPSAGDVGPIKILKLKDKKGLLTVSYDVEA